MKFLENLEDYLPQNLSSETLYYVRATFGAMAAYSTVAINPVAGALVLLGHGVWEYAGLYMRPDITEQEKRVTCYNQAFEKLRAKAEHSGSECSKTEIENAKNIFFVHNLIEEVCYKALIEIVEELDIRGDTITEKQSGIILAHLKKIAHVELRKPDGYTNKGRQMITEEQFSKVLANINTIIHDRDGRLTDARYRSLTDLCVALDDHNSYVKNILFNSWFRCDDMHCSTHLDMIKGVVDFDKRMAAQTGFDFARALQEKKDYYDTYHGSIRQIESPETGKKTASEFVNVARVRGLFTNEIIKPLLEVERDTPLTTWLEESRLFGGSEIKTLTKSRRVSCAPRFHKKIDQDPLLDETLTVGQFLNKYFPEMTNDVDISAEPPDYVGYEIPGQQMNS
ncbi:hypothetical protein [Legionella spiritensis]|uniref:Uncharacterized protein n=1 Tax=Legionella spiritensis TaxID=452 RepID=A0A0W0YVT8_LEGSP|nr:hypothetical protein [Legionella spiritensis]KTD60988.1 hypothetical protein Lspi_2899 [Legionella spiritensis]SNV32197.1 Uncharacterised protein [Legionella spiritensis]